MLVVATAGHVDHGKSTLVRALTGMEPDRWDEERRRGLTIDLGFVWTDRIVFVDVPGHERFLANALAGLGPAPAALVVVAADEGWREQTEEQCRALEMLGVHHIAAAVTRTDLASPAQAVEQVRQRLGVTPVLVSAVTGEGLDDVRVALDLLAQQVGTAPDQQRPRLWVDRVFAVAGAGTVVTGTLGGGALAVGDAVEVAGRAANIRGLESCGRPISAAAPGSRVAVALRGVDRAEVRRGDTLVQPRQWCRVDVVDVQCTEEMRLPARATWHVGSAAASVRIRPLGGTFVRLTLTEPLPLQIGDRGLLRDPGGAGLLTGVIVADVVATPLQRRGAAAERAQALAARTPLQRRGIVRASDLAAAGAIADDDAVRVGDWLIAADAYARLQARARELPDGEPLPAATRALGVGDTALVRALLPTSWRVVAGRVSRDDQSCPPEVVALRRRLQRHAFDPDAPTLARDVVAAAARHGLVLSLGGGVAVLPDALDIAATRLREIPAPFSVGAARDALRTSRRIAVPVLEALDARGVTTRLADGRRVVNAQRQRR